MSQSAAPADEQFVPRPQIHGVATGQPVLPLAVFAHGELRGVNMISGELAQHWATDSQTVPEVSGESLTTVLANDMEYASYVNDEQGGRSGALLVGVVVERHPRQGGSQIVRQGAGEGLQAFRPRPLR